MIRMWVLNSIPDFVHGDQGLYMACYANAVLLKCRSQIMIYKSASFRPICELCKNVPDRIKRTWPIHIYNMYHVSVVNQFAYNVSAL